MATPTPDLYTRALTILNDEHRATADEHGWGCSCGKGGHGAQMARPGAWRGARSRHLQAESQKIIARLREQS
jgi:hypothetical protein